MRRLAVVVGMLAAPLLVTVGCSLAVSTSGLAGPPLEPDAGPGASESGTEAAAPDDAGASFCAQHEGATFCADFDEDPNPTAGFTDASTKGDNSMSLSVDAVSAPHALLTRVGKTPNTNDQASARPYFELPFVPKTLHLELDTKLCNLDDGFIEFVKIETSSAGLHVDPPGFESADVALTFDSATENSAIAIEYYNADGSHGGGGNLLPQKFQVGTWTHLSMDIVFAQGNTGSASLTIDRGPKPVIALTNTRTLGASVSAMRVLVGAFTSEATAACTNLFDNVLIEASP